MDDALSADERTRVEQMLREDASVASELEQLKQIRQTLQQIRNQDRDVKLPANFAQSVIEATVARGRAEGLSDDHPVMRLSEQPSPMVTRPRASMWRVVAPLAAIAASLALAFFATRPDPQGDPVAAVDPARDRMAELTTDPAVAARDATPGDAVSIDPTTLHETPRFAASQTDPTMDAPVASARREAPAAIESVAEARGSNDAEMKVAMGPAVSPPTSALKSVEPSPPPADVVAIKAVLVLEVHRTMDGRNTHAVETAMEAAGIDSASRKSIDENVVRFAKQGSADEVAANSASVLYLEAPAKRLDQFILRLIADEQGIESVSMTIANDPPLVGMIQSLREVDPTTVKHSTSWQLDAGANGTSALASHLSDRAYVRLDRSTASMAVTASGDDASASTASDIVGRVLMIVR